VASRVVSVARRCQSTFAHIQEGPADPILVTALHFRADPSPNKINLGMGAYRTEAGQPYVLPVVHEAEVQLLKELGDTINKEYATIDGPEELKRLTQNLVFGEDSAAVKEGRICSIQALSGTGSLRVAAEFLRYNVPDLTEVWFSNPTWGNHFPIFKKAGLENHKIYPYFDASTNGFDFEGMMAALQEASPGAGVLLHACAHNPSGVDPSPEQWQKIANLCKERNLLPIMDSAYQGYASGDLDKDAYAIRLFESMGMQFVLCQSFAKNLGLYGERMGMMHIVTGSADEAKRVLSQVKLIVRPMYSSPPIHGAQLVTKILGDPAMFAAWKSQLSEMADRINEVRVLLREGLEKKGTPGQWNHITDQIGMFSFTGLSEPMCVRLIEKHHIYLLKTGRISMAGLNKGNIQHMIDSVDEVVRACS